MKQVRMLIWAAMHDKHFQQRQFFVPPRVDFHQGWYHLEIYLVYPEIRNPFPSDIYQRAGLVSIYVDPDESEIPF